MKDPLPLIASCRLLAGLPGPAQQRLAATARLRRLAHGDALFQQGDPATHVFLVGSGRIRLSQVGPDGNQVIMRLIQAGELFGWVAVARGIAFPVTAEADGPTRLLSWERETMAEVADQAPELAMGGLTLVAGRMHQLQERFRELATQSVPQRLAKTLLRLEKEAPRRGGTLPLRLRLRGQDLAEISGTTLFSVSRLLAQWRKEGWIDSGRGWVSLVDSRPLARLAGAEESEALREVAGRQT